MTPATPADTIGVARHTIFKDFTFAAAHAIRGHTRGRQNLHGHNYRVRVHVRAERLDELGMVLDVADLKKMMQEILGPFDHPPCALLPLLPPPVSNPSPSRRGTLPLKTVACLPRGRRRTITVDDCPGGGIDAAVRVALAPRATPPPGLAGPASV